jgi:Fe-S oxidoreductase
MIDLLVRGEYVDEMYQCVTCFACNEYCPKKARPFDLILTRLEEWGNHVTPETFHAVRQSLVTSAAFIPPVVSEPVLALCTIEPGMPFTLEGQLFENMSIVKGNHFACSLIFSHLGNKTLMCEGLRLLVKKYASLNVDEIIFLHDNCYSLMAEIAPTLGIELSFRPVHIFEYLLDYMKRNKYHIRPLNLKIAYQRPCASRFTPWKEPMLDEILKLIGVERIARQFDREDALCCGQTFNKSIRGDRMAYFQNLNIRDATRHGASAMVFLCPLCLDALSLQTKHEGLESYMITDLCRLALRETLRTF